MDRKLFKNIIISTFFFGNSLLGTETRERETESASQEEQAQKTLNDELLQAIALGDATHLKDLLEKGANPNQIIFLFDKKSGEFHSTTPLIHAITSGNTDIVEILLANGANADQADDHGTTPLHAAMNICRPDDIKKVELLLQEMPNPNARDADSCTPLMLLVARIIELTRLSREENEKKHTTLDLSQSISCCFKGLELLVDHGADTNVRDGDGNTAVIRAIPPYALYLNIPPYASCLNILPYASCSNILPYASCLNLELFEILIELGADVNILNNKKRTALSYALALRKKAEAANNQELVDQCNQLIALLCKHGATEGQSDETNEIEDETGNQPKDEPIASSHEHGTTGSRSDETSETEDETETQSEDELIVLLHERGTTESQSDETSETEDETETQSEDKEKTEDSKN